MNATGFPWWLSGKESACQSRRCEFDPWDPWDDPLEKEMATHSSQYSCLGNPIDSGTWWATVHGVAKELDMT